MHRKYKLAKALTRPVLGAALGLFVLVFGAVGSIAAVDHALHHAANSHSGACEICAFAGSQVESASTLLAICPPATPAVFAAIPTGNFFPQDASSLLPPGRAPPIASAVS